MIAGSRRDFHHLGTWTTDPTLGPISIDGQDLTYADPNNIQPDKISAGVLGLAYPKVFDTSP